MPSTPNVSDRIDHLFKTIRRPDGREFTYDDVELGTEGRVSRSYVWKLRHGRNRNPSMEVIESLSEFFGVPPAYFFGEEPHRRRAAPDAAEVAALLKDESARTVAEGARGLSPEALSIVQDLITGLRAMECTGRDKMASASSA